MKLLSLTPDLISVFAEVDGMGHGAAHPYEHWSHVHWLRKDGRKLRAGDVFKENSP